MPHHVPNTPFPVHFHLMSDTFSLDGRTALITGGSRGIGLAVAREFVAAGARVIITARGQEGLNDALRALGANALALPCDNADPAAIARMVERAWSISPIDIVVNNAGISPFYKRAEHVTVEDWDTVSEVNTRGTYFCSIENAKRMFAAERPGSIVNVSSVAASVPAERLAAYAAAKAAIIQFSKVMALEWADRRVRVNVIAPGWTETAFTADLFASHFGDRLKADIPLGRFAVPGDVTGAALYLASDASSYVTGSVLTVDGGRSLR